jgi:hypothetical protein
MEQGHCLHLQIPLDLESAESPSDPWPMEMDIQILKFMTTWAIETPFKSQQLGGKDPMLSTFEEIYPGPYRLENYGASHPEDGTCDRQPFDILHGQILARRSETPQLRKVLQRTSYKAPWPT